MALRGTITTFSADNKAAWSIAGFKDLGRAFRRCQFCLAVNEDMQTKVCHSFDLPLLLIAWWMECIIPFCERAVYLCSQYLLSFA